MLTAKVRWSDTESLCASGELTEKAKERAGCGPCLFFTFNDYNGCEADMGIRNCLVREYPKNVLYEDIKSEWGRGCNMFLFGEELLGKGEDFDEDEVCQCVYAYALDKGYIKRAEDKLFREAWCDYCETRKINFKDRKKRDAFKNSIRSLTDTNDAIIGAYGIDYVEHLLDRKMKACTQMSNI